ncbi:MAG: M6 family metalloprotease domain-containing protein, partial [Candidatus Cloacimonadaceae bacterium]|nr:M6 family metalloprotease domain-containing protein [Candidatus Cloacimonadaceae bacterium]
YSNGRSPHIGQFNNLVVFIKFSDDPDFSHPITYYDDMFNEVGENANSQRNYFLQASYQQLTVDSFFYPVPNGTTIVTYVDPMPRNYYRPISVANPMGYDPDDPYERTIREQTMLANSITYVSSQVPASLVIDGDNDGYVDNVCFIIQGQSDGWAELLWPHRWVMYYVESYLHGKRVWDFNLQLENFLFSSGASVLAHEMFHSLSAPDLYRYSDSTITPIGQWDLMAGNTNPPQHMSVWMKYRYGEWIDNVPIISQSGDYTLYPVASHATNNIYRIMSWRTGESYVLEYRKGSGFYDHNLPGSGLMVYRLDTRVSGNADGPPDELYLYRPNGVNPTTNGVLSQAHYSAQLGRTSITEATIPSGFLGNNLPGGINLYNIGQAGESISFSVKISDIQLTYPTGGEVWFASTNKTITWKAKTTSGNVSIEYSLNNGSSWNMIVAATPNDGDYTWANIPFANTSEGRIRITLLSNGHTDINTNSFHIISEVGAPAPLYPANNAAGVETDPQISWEPVFGANSYQFQLSQDEEFDSYLVNILNHPHSNYSAMVLQPFSTYYWRVATVSDIGYSEFCPTQTFSTGQTTVLPGTVTLVLPTNNATNQAMNLILQWNPANHASSYEIQLARNNFFTDGLIEHSGIAGSSFQVSGLESNTQYHWRVRGENPAGGGNYSGIRRFTT